MFYKIEGDTMFFMPEDDINKVVSKKRIEIFLIFFYDHKYRNLKFDFIKIKK